MSDIENESGPSAEKRPRKPRAANPSSAIPASNTGNSLLNLTGNALANVITGNDADNLIIGGLGADTLRKLRRGHWLIQDEIDLHGMIVAEARPVLVTFLNECLRDGLRCVRIIHGKGLGSPGRTPVLKARVLRWPMAVPLASRWLPAATFDLRQLMAICAATEYRDLSLAVEALAPAKPEAP